MQKNIVSDVDPLSYVLHSEKCIHIPEINIHEIISVVSSLSNGAAGYDEIPASIMKQHVELYAKPLTFLINMSISQGIFPEEMKIAKVLPIYKGEDEQLIQN